jgi:di/tricarboxylate transporter
MSRERVEDKTIGSPSSVIERFIQPNLKKILICLVIVASIALLNPLGLDFNQQIVFSGLLMTVLMWATHAVAQSAASIFLLILFSIFGQTPLPSVFKFPLSTNFIVIAMSFLMSQAIVNAGIAARLADNLLARFVRKSSDLVWVALVTNILLSFLILQPFSRTILLAAIFIEYLKRHNANEDTREAVMLSLFVLAVTTLMMFITADVILNNFAVSISGVEISWLEWAKWMALPSAITSVIVAFMLILLFKKGFSGPLKSAEPDAAHPETEETETDTYTDMEQEQEPDTEPDHLVSHGRFQTGEKQVLVIVLAAVGLWMTESVHGLSSAWVALVSVVCLFLTRNLTARDFKFMNIHLLIFLTAAFSIGSVMQNSGVSGVLFSVFNTEALLASSAPNLAIIGLNAILHLFVGSTVTTLSITVPGLLALTAGVLNPVAVMLTSYVTVNLHFFLPFHQVVLLIGSSYYSVRSIVKIGVVMTFLTPLLILFLYLPYWRLIQ